MGVRLSGLASGLDTESIISELMSAQSLKKTKIENKLTKLEWKEEIWEELNTSIYSFYTGALTSLKAQKNYLTKSVSCSDTTSLSFSATYSVPTGTQTVQINSVASSQYVTGSQLSGSYTTSSKLKALGVEVGSVFTLTTNVLDDDSSSETSTFVVDSSTTISDLADWCDEYGITLSYSTDNKRFYISSDSGAENSFTLTSSSPGTDTTEYETTIQDSCDYDNLSDDDQEAIDDALTVIATYGSDTDEYSDAVTTLNTYAGEDISSTLESYASSFSGTSALTYLGLSEMSVETDDSGNKQVVLADSTDCGIVQASDCTITYNGVEYTSSDNSQTINGLTIKAYSTTDELNITISNDSTAVYDMVKSFISEYNTLLETMNDYYYADSASDYEVLTDDEEDEMSDTEIENWENKIKSALLRRDTSLNSVISAMRSISSASVDYNGTSYSLASFGIVTIDYSEKGQLHIYGDSTDSDTCDYDDQLQAAIEDDPELVMTVLTTIAKQLYTSLSNQCTSTTLRSTQNFYNDKEITSLKSQYEDEIEEWEDKLADLEDRYYSKFTVMETALAKLNAQTSYISALFSS